VLGRRPERTRLDEILDRIRDGHSATLVLEGGPGLGKTTLLNYLVEQGAGVTLLTTTGTQSEFGLPYAALHQLCHPVIGALEVLPAPQREALETTFGMRTGPVPGTFLIGLAALGLISEVSRVAPVLCVIDDAQWMDRASADVLGFVARRLEADAVGMVFATRSAGDTPWLERIPLLALRGLERAAAAELLATLAPGRIEPAAMDRILDEADGIPLVLVEAARTLKRTEISTGIIREEVSSDPDRLEAQFGVRLRALPLETQRLLLIAAAEPTANPLRIRAAAASLGAAADALRPAVEAGLCHDDTTVRFRHPLVRSAVYRTASGEELRAAHAALARASPADSDPDLLAWHRACACDSTDEEVAAELAVASERMLERGAPAAAAVLLRKARQVTADEAQRVRWSLRIAQAELAAGDFDASEREMVASHTAMLSPALLAEAKLTEARLAFTRERGGTAVPLLLRAAELLSAVTTDAAEEAYLEAFSAALFGGTLTRTDLAQVSKRWQATEFPDGGRPAHRLLDALSAIVISGGPTAWQRLRETLSTIEDGTGRHESSLPALWVASVAAAAAWDIESWDAISHRLVTTSRDAGDYGELPTALSSRAFVQLFTGELRAAVEAVQETETITSATGGRMTPYGAIGVAALSGREPELDALVEATMPSAEARSDATGISIACWAQGLLNNGMGRYAEALAWTTRARPLYQDLHASSVWVLVELIESASRTDRLADARAALRLLASTAESSGTAWGLGVLARSRALAGDEARTEEHYAESLRLLEPTRCALDLARTSLAYGEWLRRQRRLSDAREHLVRAVDLFESMGAAAFAARGTRELRAAGSQLRKPGTTAASVLTVQESQIARLVAQGLTNAEVATRMFLSPRTVEYHLAKVFGKLQLKSRHQLAALPAGTF
jgi:DNA-binding CsgD family transcriptional regulator